MTGDDDVAEGVARPPGAADLGDLEAPTAAAASGPGGVQPCAAAESIIDALRREEAQNKANIVRIFAVSDNNYHHQRVISKRQILF